MNSPVASCSQIFTLPMRVYYEDTDAAGVVYYANYLRFLERARTEWLRTQGVDQAKLAETSGIAFAVRHLECDYFRPARLDNELTVSVQITLVRAAQVIFDQRIECDGICLLKAKVRVACITVPAMRPTPIPQEIRAKLLEYYGS